MPVGGTWPHRKERSGCGDANRSPSAPGRCRPRRPSSARRFSTAPCGSSSPTRRAAPANILARLVAEPLGRALGQNVIVENCAGRRNIGADAVAQSPPDGHSMLLLDVACSPPTPSSSRACPSTWSVTWRRCRRACKIVGAGRRSGTSRARGRGEDGPKAVRWVRLAMEMPQPGVAMETSPPRFCMLSSKSRCSAVARRSPSRAPLLQSRASPNHLRRARCASSRTPTSPTSTRSGARRSSAASTASWSTTRFTVPTLTSAPTRRWRRATRSRRAARLHRRAPRGAALPRRRAGARARLRRQPPALDEAEPGRRRRSRSASTRWTCRTTGAWSSASGGPSRT